MKQPVFHCKVEQVIVCASVCVSGAGGTGGGAAGFSILFYWLFFPVTLLRKSQASLEDPRLFLRGIKGSG